MRKKIGYLFAAALTAACVLSAVPEVSVMASDTQEVSDAEYKPEIGSTSWVLLEERYSSGDGSNEYVAESHEYDPATGFEVKRVISGIIYTYEYDSNGYITKSEEYSSYDGTLRSTTEYGENNHKTITHLYSSGENDGYIEYEYDSEGKEIGRRYNANGEYYGDLEVEYFDNGEIKRQYNSDISGTSLLQVKNENGDTIEFHLIEHGSLTSHWTVTYENGRLARKDLQMRGQEDEYDIYTYEDTDKGFIRTQTTYDTDDNVKYTYQSTFEFEYDENGNKIKETIKDENGEVSGVYTYTYLKKEFDTRGHYIPNFDAYDAPEGCTFQYRLYNPNSGEHFYTGSRRESCNLIYEGWNFEGSGFIHPLIGDPIYRMYDNKGDHLYTMDVAEKELLESQGWTTEGVAFPSSTEAAGGRPMFRLKNPNATTGVHHFTMSEEERDHLKSLGWIYEGIGWYSV